MEVKSGKRKKNTTAKTFLGINVKRMFMQIRSDRRFCLMSFARKKKELLQR